MEIVTWLRKEHIVTFPQDRQECSFIVDGEKVILTTTGYKRKRSTGSLWLDFNLPTTITTVEKCDWVYCYIPLAENKSLYRMSIPLLLEKGMLRYRFSVQTSLITNYPLEFVGTVTKTKRGNFGDHTYMKEVVRNMKRGENGKFLPMKLMVRGGE